MRMPIITLVPDTVRDRKGIAAREYAPLAVGFLVYISAIVSNIGTNLSNLFTKVACIR